MSGHQNRNSDTIKQAIHSHISYCLEFVPLGACVEEKFTSAAEKKLQFLTNDTLLKSNERIKLCLYYREF